MNLHFYNANNYENTTEVSLLFKCAIYDLAPNAKLEKGNYKI